MSAIAIGLISVAALALALFLAFVPLRLMLDFMAKRVAEPIREFMKRRKERRSVKRETNDRRGTPA